MEKKIMNKKAKSMISVGLIVFLILIFFITSYFVLAGSFEEDNPIIIYTPSSDKTCQDGVCNLIIYSGIRNIYEDDTWKRVEDARSLMPLYNDSFYIKNDTKGNKIRVLDFNLTDAHICVKSSNTGDVSFKTYKMGEVFNEIWGEYFNERIYSEDSIVSITSKDTDHCFWVHTNILQNTIVFGDEIDKREAGPK